MRTTDIYLYNENAGKCEKLCTFLIFIMQKTVTDRHIEDVNYKASAGDLRYKLKAV
jgi:hypothetical protein